MRKSRLLIIFVLIALITSLFGGCGVSQAVEDAKNRLDDYFTSFTDENAEAMTLVMHPSLIEELGGEEALQTRLMSRRALLGEVEEYKVANTAFESSNGVTEVILTVNTDYSLGESAEEVYTFLTVGDDLYMTAIDLPEEKAMDGIANEFFSALNDPEAMSALYIPMFKGSEITTILELLSERLFEAGGEYIGYSLTNQQFDYQSLGEATFVYVGAYTLNFKRMDAVCELQMSVQNGELGLNNVEITPSHAVQLCKDYYYAIGQKDVEGAADLYAEVFYDETGRSEWISSFLQPICNDYGSLISYDIVEWDVKETELPDGTLVDTIVLRIYSEYDDIQLEELILLSYGDNKSEILSHQISQLEA